MPSKISSNADVIQSHLHESPYYMQDTGLGIIEDATVVPYMVYVFQAEENQCLRESFH